MKTVGRLFPSLAAAALLLTCGTAWAGVFGTSEKPYDDIAPLKQWVSVLERHAIELAGHAANTQPCRKGETIWCGYGEWMAFLDTLRDLPADQQLSAVNRWANKSRYILDQRNWGKTDYWETPGQFLAMSGDCEDFSTVKYYSLRLLGWPADALRVVILQDLNLKIAHAVLAVEHEGKTLILDNQISIVVEDTRIRHYRPVYSVNENRWWRHLPAQ